jgi:hypothetical protein
MHAKFFENNPFRRPQWRADRVLQLVEHRPAPLRPRIFDDHYVRVYRRFLLLYLAAGADENQRYAASMERPEVYHAHMLRYHPDTEWRQILEARILTQEPLSEIAKRFLTSDKAIELYEALFFNIRDRLNCRDWIAKQIIGPRECLVPSRHGTLTEDQRGFLYRLFAYHGGPLALDALIAGLSPDKLPPSRQDLAGWFDDALVQLVRSRAVAAAGVLDVDRNNVLHLLKLALRQKHTATSKAGRHAQQADLDDGQLEKIMAAVERSMGGWKLPNEEPQTPTTGAVEQPSGTLGANRDGSPRATFQADADCKSAAPAGIQETTIDPLAFDWQPPEYEPMLDPSPQAVETPLCCHEILG